MNVMNVSYRVTHCLKLSPEPQSGWSNPVVIVGYDYGIMPDFAQQVELVKGKLKEDGLVMTDQSLIL